MISWGILVCVYAFVAGFVLGFFQPAQEIVNYLFWEFIFEKTNSHPLRSILKTDEMDQKVRFFICFKFQLYIAEVIFFHYVFSEILQNIYQQKLGLFSAWSGILWKSVTLKFYQVNEIFNNSARDSSTKIQRWIYPDSRATTRHSVAANHISHLSSSFFSYK